jgi:hypothetical protein
LVCVLLALVGTAQGWFKFLPFGNKTNADQEARVEQTLNNYKQGLVKYYERSKAKPIFQGDLFPKLDYPVIKGTSPDWSKPSIVVFGLGTSASNTVDELFTPLKAVDIQKIYVFSLPPLLSERISEFPEDIILLDATDNELGDSGFNLSQDVYERMGINGTSAYLIGNNQKVLFSQVNRGGFSNLVTATKNFVQGIETANDQVIVSNEQTLSLDKLPIEFHDLVSQELSKPVTIIFFSDKTWCDTCQSWLSFGESFIKSWREKGYGLILVEGGGEAFSLEYQPNGILNIQDVYKSGSHGESVLSSSWGVMPVPSTYLLKKGHFTGSVSWVEIDINGKPYKDIHFRAINEILKTLGQ